MLRGRHKVGPEDEADSSLNSSLSFNGDDPETGEQAGFDDMPIEYWEDEGEDDGEDEEWDSPWRRAEEVYDDEDC